MKFILGKKVEMTQVFDESGVVHPATVLEAGPLVITQVKTGEKDNYTAVQVGFQEQKQHRLSKAVQGHLKDLGFFKILKEFRLDSETELNVGDKIDVSVFEPGDIVQVSATSKGKGFQGVVKRWNFSGGPRTHGQKHTERAPGSIGSQGPQRVFKGRKMPGRTGGKRVTVKNLKVLQVIPEKNILVISGAIPGARGALVEVISK